MKKFTFATIAASGLAAAFLGLAAPAQAVTPVVPTGLPTATEISAGIDRHGWLDQIGPNVNVPQVDTSVRARTITN